MDLHKTYSLAKATLAKTKFNVVKKKIVIKDKLFKLENFIAKS